MFGNAERRLIEQNDIIHEQSQAEELVFQQVIFLFLFFFLIDLHVCNTNVNKSIVALCNEHVPETTTTTMAAGAPSLFTFGEHC